MGGTHFPPSVFFDTNVILGLGDTGEAALRRDPFGKYRAAFQRVNSLFDGVLPSAESVLMTGVGLKE